MCKRAPSPGFTLIELMIVIAVIGITTAIALPRFLDQGIRAKEKEADKALRHVYMLQHAYRAAHGEFATTPGALEGFGYVPPTLRYYVWSDEAVTTSDHCVPVYPAGAGHRAKRIDFETGEIADCP